MTPVALALGLLLAAAPPAPAVLPAAPPAEAPAPRTSAPAAQPDPELAAAREEALRAAEAGQGAKALEAWKACAASAERALRRLDPRWAAAVDAGDDAVAAAGTLPAQAAEPLYWMAACAGSAARLRGFEATLAVSAQVRPLLERAAALDETVFHAGPRRALGAWVAALPGAAGGGEAEARRHFERARQLAPAFQLTRVEEARTWAVLVQDRAAFERLLREVLASKPEAAPELERWNAVARREAAALLARADTLF